MDKVKFHNLLNAVAMGAMSNPDVSRLYPDQFAAHVVRYAVAISAELEKLNPNNLAQHNHETPEKSCES